MSASSVLRVENLVVEIPTRHSVLHPVDDVSFSIEQGEILGIVGESGAGKSMTGNAIMGLLEEPATIKNGSVFLKNQNITSNHADHSAIRGKKIGMVFQDPLTSLNPLLTIGSQLIETIREHSSVSLAGARIRAISSLADVGIPSPEARLDAFPHQLSGGMRQRVVIALTLAPEPYLIICDEPTTALDVSIQAQIIALLQKLCNEKNVAIMLITHDMGVIAEMASRIAVMYMGRIVEMGSVEKVLTSPLHPYTQGLMRAIPQNRSIAKLEPIPGNVPKLSELPEGCSFHPRCPVAITKCRSNPRPDISSCGGKTACWLAS